MAIFNSYFDITRGYLDNDQQILKFWWFPGFPLPEATLNVLAKARRWEEVRVFREGHGEDMDFSCGEVKRRIWIC